MNITIKYLVSFSIALSSVQICSLANAAEDDGTYSGLEEIIVTASRREESLQDASLAVSALSGSMLEDLGAQNLGDYFGFVPSVNAAHNTYGQRGGQNIVIRGIANARLGGTDASLLSSTTGFYLNDVPITPVDTQIFDIDRVEVLRGPQGTLYGAASMGGSVKLYHNRPNTSEFSGLVEGTAEVVNSGGEGGGLNAMINLPIVEGIVAARFVGTIRNVGGYIDQIIPPLTQTVPNALYPLAPGLDLVQTDSPIYKKDTNSSQSKSLRAAVLYTPNDRLTIDAAVMWQSASVDDMSQFNTIYSKDRLNEVYQLEPKESEMTLTSLNIAYEFSSVSFFSDTGFYTRQYDELIDFTQTMYALGGVAAAGLDFIPALGVLEGVFEVDTITQEVRLQSNYQDSNNSFLSKTSWIVGAFYMNEDRRGSQNLHAPGWGAAAPSIPLPVANDIYLANTWDVVDKNTAFFADVSFNITERLAIAAGIRYFDQSTDQDRPQLNPANTVIPLETITGQAETGSIPRLNVSYNLSDSMMLYGSFAEGFRLGGATLPIDLAATPECESVIIDNNLQVFAEGQYSSDSVETYEVGLKSGFADGRVTLNVSAYQTDWSNLQQQVSLGNFPNSICTRVLTANVGAAKVDGFEFETAAMVSDNIRLQASLSYTDARIDEPGEGVTVTESGDRIQNVPDWAGSLIANYTVPINVLGGGDFFLQGDLRYMGERSSVVGEPADPLLILDPYTLIGLRTGVTIKDDSLTMTLYVKNIMDEIIELNAQGRFGVSGNTLVNTGMPRTVGVTLMKRF